MCNKMWAIKAILKTDEGRELNFVVILKSKMKSNLDNRHESVTSNLCITKQDSLTLMSLLMSKREENGHSRMHMYINLNGTKVIQLFYLWMMTLA